MDLVTPGFGLVFWMTLSFLIIVFLLGKFAWKPILKAIKEREDTIQDALEAADRAKEEMRKLKESNESLLQQAREERDQLMKEARETKDQIISEARNKAKEEADKILASSREEIKNEKTKAIEELKGQVAEISFQIAEKVLAEKLADSDKQSESVKKALSEINFN
ncbi:MAG: F0F1 ATP synthase subunit B [Flavobacteriales bacterium]